VTGKGQGECGCNRLAQQKPHHVDLHWPMLFQQFYLFVDFFKVRFVIVGIIQFQRCHCSRVDELVIKSSREVCRDCWQVLVIVVGTAVDDGVMHFVW